MKLKHININSFKGLKSVAIENCGDLNVFFGKNNSGKSSILHAIDIAGLAISFNDWDKFRLKMETKDLFDDLGSFSIVITYQDDDTTTITSSANFVPTVTPRPNEILKFNTILLSPQSSLDTSNRGQVTPKSALSYLESRSYQNFNSLDILYAIQYYSTRNEKGFTPETYSSLISEIIHYFPELDEVKSDKNDADIATLVYKEFGKKLDILYSGSGLKHFIDIFVKITLSGAKVVLLDEPEFGLHPDLQRRFVEYLKKMSIEKEIQFFLATHSPIFFNYPDLTTCYKIVNKKGEREVFSVPSESLHTLISDCGIRPSDVFNYDICLLVEGMNDVVFFTHIIHTLYKEDFKNIAITIQQYGGGAAEGIVSGSINVSNITPAQKYTFWIRDRDARPDEKPSTNSTKFCNKLAEAGCTCHILKKREIEYYYPEKIHIVAQQGDPRKEKATLEILKSDQSAKYKTAAEKCEICVPRGKNLRKLLSEHLTSKEQLDVEINEIIKKGIIPWVKEILGE